MGKRKAFVANRSWRKDAMKASVGEREARPYQPNSRQDGRKEVSMYDAVEAAAADP